MNQQTQNNNPDSSGDLPLKRKRGRPRKYPKVDGEDTSTPINRIRNRVSGEKALQLPGFEKVNGNQSSQNALENNSDEAMVGQVVLGVCEGTFSGGFLIRVKIGNADTSMSGLVFKPGHYVPITPENDVAPSVPVIQRHMVPFPVGTFSQAQNPQPKERSQQHYNIVSQNESHKVNGSPSISQVPQGAVISSNLTSSQGKNVPAMTEQTSHPLTISNAVLTVLPPNNVVPVNNQQPQVTTHSSLGSVPGVTKEIPADGSQVPSAQIHPLARGDVAPTVLPSDNSSNVVLVNNQIPQVVTQASLASLSGVNKEIPAPGNQVPSSETHPLAQVNAVPIELPPGNSPNAVLVNQPHQVTAQTSLGSISGGAKQFPATENQVPSHSLTRDSLVPIILPPGNTSNPVLVDKQPPLVMATQASPGIVSSVAKEIQADGNKVPSSQTRTSQTTLPSGVQNEDSTLDLSSTFALNEKETEAMKLPEIPFQKLVTEVVKRIRVPSDSLETETDHSKSGDNIPLNNRPDDKANHIDPSIMNIEPMQDVGPGPNASTSEPLEIHNTEKMTEMLQVK